MNKVFAHLFHSIDEKNFSPAIRYIWILLLLCLASIATYMSALNNPFMMDDGTLIFGDPTRHQPAQVWNHFLPSYEHGLSEVKDQTLGAKYFRPWAHALPLWCYALFKDQVFFYHVFNVVLLVIAGFLFYRFLVMLFKEESPAFLAALLFVVHPINGLLVNYVTASALSLMVIFSLVALMCVMRAFRSQGSQASVTAALGVFFYINAMFCHETAIMLPLFAAIALWYVNPDIRKIFYVLLPLNLVAIAYFVFRMFYASLKSSLFDKAYVIHISPMDYAAAFTKLVAWYLGALTALHDIVLIKSVELVSWNTGFWVMLLIGLFVLAYGIFRFCHNRLARFGLLFFIAGFLPVTLACFFQSSAGLILEPHWMLIGSLGFFTGVAVFLDAYGWVMGGLWRTLMIVFVIGMCVIRAGEYNRLWHDQKTYSEYWARVSPSLDLPLFFLGDAYIERENWPEAKKAYLQAAQKSQRPFEYYYNVAGILLLEGGDLQQAKDLLLRALAIYPESSMARISLGMIYSVLDGEHETAERLFKEAIDLNPRSSEARTRLAELYVGQEKFAQAAEQYEAIFRNDPMQDHLPEKIMNLHLKTNDEAKIIAAANSLLKMVNDPRRLLDIAILLTQARHMIAAELYFEKALMKGPDQRDVYAEAGKFLGNLNDFDGAMVIWNEGLARHPGDPLLTGLVEQAKLLKGKQSGI